MKFGFEVGQQEKHDVEFRWGRMFGVAKIWVDGSLILKSRALAWQDLTRAASLGTVTGSIRYLSKLPSDLANRGRVTVWNFEMGQQERHAVCIEQEMPKILPAFRAYQYRIFVDEKLTFEHSG
jgi:hypothetical protein